VPVFGRRIFCGKPIAVRSRRRSFEITFAPSRLGGEMLGIETSALDPRGPPQHIKPSKCR